MLADSVPSRLKDNDSSSIHSMNTISGLFSDDGEESSRLDIYLSSTRDLHSDEAPGGSSRQRVTESWKTLVKKREGSMCSGSLSQLLDSSKNADDVYTKQVFPLDRNKVSIGKEEPANPKSSRRRHEQVVTERQSDSKCTISTKLPSLTGSDKQNFITKTIEAALQIATENEGEVSKNLQVSAFSSSVPRSVKRCQPRHSKSFDIPSPTKTSALRKKSERPSRQESRPTSSYSGGLYPFLGPLTNDHRLPSDTEKNLLLVAKRSIHVPRDHSDLVGSSSNHSGMSSLGMQSTSSDESFASEVTFPRRSLRPHKSCFPSVDVTLTGHTSNSRKDATPKRPLRLRSVSPLR
jgi:hypothetical protein